MKSGFILFCLIIVFGFCSSAQDLIVTTKGDSINCVITKVQSDHIFFTYFNNSQQVNSLLSMDQVTHYATNYYAEGRQLSQVITPAKSSPFQYDISGGFSYRLAGIDPGADAFLRDYMSGLLLGYYFGGDVNYYFYESLGIGMKFSSALYSNKVENVLVTFDDGTSKVGTVSDNIWLTYIGPSLTFRYFPGNNNNSITMGCTMGYIRYKNNCMVIDPFKMTGNSVGMGFDFGYNFEVSPTSSFGLKLSYIMGLLTKMEISDNTSSYTYEMETGEFESLGRLDFGVALTF